MQELFQAVSEKLAETSAGARPVSLVAVELDRIHALRSTLGPSAADDVCDQVTHMLGQIVRTGDYVTRISNGELVVVLLGAGSADARSVGQRIGAAVRGHPFPPPNGTRSAKPATHVTVSVGVAATPEHGSDPEALFSAATRARGAVAERGGDGIAVASGPGGEPGPRIPDVERLAGRVDERRTLFRLLEEAARGHPRVVSIIGETGSGTLTLTRQLEPEVRLIGGAMVYGSAVPSAIRAPYGPWAGVLRGIQRLPTPVDHVWQELPKLVPELAREPRQPRETTGTKYRLLEELGACLRTAARDWPLVVVLNEMQWADEGSWDALDHLVEHFTDEKLLICVALRSGGEHASATERLAGLRRRTEYQELQLSRLTRDDVKQWIESALDHQEVGRELLSFAYRHTEGNPFLLTQLLRCMTEEGLLWHNGERWEWKPVSELRLPSGLAAIVGRRVARFSLSTQAVLSAGAIVGREFDVPLVAAAGAGSAAAVHLALDEAVSAGVLQAVYDRKHRAFAFAHDSISDVLVRSQPADRLRQLHEHVARAAETRNAANSGELALHYDAAGASAEAYGAALDAATQADGLYAHSVASEYLNLAARNAASPAELAEVRVRLIHIADVLGKYDEEEELCDLAIGWFTGQGEQRRTLTLRRMREHARKELGQPARLSLEALLVLDHEAMTLGFEQERIAILNLRSQAYDRLGETREAERIATECVRMAESVGDPLLLGEAVNRLGITIKAESPAGARECWERALELFRQAGDVRGQVRCYNNLGLVAQLESRIDVARESLTMAVSLARAAGMADLWGTAAHNLGVMLQKLGEYERARAMYSEALGLFAAVKNSELQLYALFNMAHAEREAGAYASSGELYDATASLAQRIGQADVEIGARAGAGLCFLALNRVGDAHTAMAEAESQMAGRMEWFQGRELVETLRVLMAARDGRRADALEQFERARALAEATDLYSAAWLTAACADALFDLDPATARAAIERYVSRVDSLGFVTLTQRYQALRDRA